MRYRIDEKLKYEAVVKDSHITKKYLKQIQQVAIQNDVPVRFILVPDVKDADKNLDSYKNKFADMLLDKDLKDSWIILPNSKANFNPAPDGHLNNRGHRYYADFIEVYLKDYFGGMQSR